MSKGKLKNLKLATKTSIIIGLILLVLLTALVAVSAIQAGKFVTRAIDGEFSGLATENGIMIQSIIDNAASAAANMQNYLLNAYEEEEAKGKTASNSKYRSKVYSANLSELNYEVENYILNTTWSLMQGNNDLTGAGVLFEPNAYDTSVKDYSLYVTLEDANNRTARSLGEHASYSAEEYYVKAKNAGQAVITQPYEYNGILISTIAYPIIFKDVMRGVFFVDINVMNFSKVKTTDEKYPTMYVDIYTSDFTIAYDSKSLDYVGEKLSAFINANDFSKITAAAANGKIFSMETAKAQDEHVVRYFFPINCGSEIWWASSTLTKDDLSKDVVFLLTVMIAMSVFAFIVIVGSTIMVLRKMLRPIDGVVSAAKEISQGNLNVQLHVTSGDEIGILSQTFIDMSHNLQEIIEDVGYTLGAMAGGNFAIKSRAEDRYVGDYQQLINAIKDINGRLSDTLLKINMASDQVSSGSNQVSSGAQALSQGATEQASSIEELAATIAEISHQIRETATHAEQASQKSGTVGAEAQESNRRMKDMLGAMDNISKSSNEIGKIIKTIEDIAFQTNILALNAAVEAARAGVAGKGFAVVADEVRNLASKSAEASKSTSALIEGSLRAVESGAKIANETAQSLNLVVEGVTEITTTIDRISSASNEQAQSITQVTIGVDQISAVVQTNSATAEESAAASEELSVQAVMLKQLVEKFNLSETDNTLQLTP